MPPKKSTSAPAVPQPCIRCPDFVRPDAPGSEEYHENFEQCQQKCPTAGDGATHSASELWWGFTSNEALVHKSLDLTKEQDCRTLLAQAKGVGDRLTKYMSERDFEIFEGQSRDAKSKAKSKGGLITKEMLEKAVQVVHPVKQTAASSTAREEKKQETGSAGAPEESKAGEAVPGPSVERTTETLEKLELEDTGGTLTGQTEDGGASMGSGEGSSTDQTTDEQWTTVKTKGATPSTKLPASLSTTSSQGPATLSVSVRPAPRPPYNDPRQRNAEAVKAGDEDAIKAVAITGEAASFDALTALNNINAYAAGIARDNLRRNGGSLADENALRQESDRVKNSHGLRTSFANDDQTEARVVTNYLRLDPPKEMYVYQVYMKRIQGTKMTKITKFADKKSLMNFIQASVPQLQAQPTNPRRWVTDGDLIWSTDNLFPETNLVAGTTVLKLPQPFCPTPDYLMQCGDQAQADSVEIEFKERITNPSVLQLCEIDSSRSYRQSTLSILLRGLNAFLTNDARGGMTPIVFTSGQRAFDLRNVPDRLDWKANPDPLRCLRGFSLSSRPGNDRVLLNINTAFSAFFNINQTVQSVLQYMAYRNRNHAQKTALLHGLQVTLEPSGDTIANPTRNWFIFGIQKGNANPPNIQVSREMTLESQRTGAVFKADKLRITSWQSFHNALTAIQTEAMINIARKKPHENHGLIGNDGLTLFHLDGGSQPTALYEPFGMSVGTEMLKVPAYRLPPVLIQYRNAVTITPGEASWNLGENPKFSEPGDKPQVLPYLDTSGIPPNALSISLRTLWEKLQIHGVLSQAGPNPEFRTPFSESNLLQRVTHDRDFDIKIWNILNSFLSASDSTPLKAPILIIIKEKDYDLFSYIKRVAELWEGQRTICVTSKKFTGFRHLSPQTASNIALKYNIKVGGTNHKLESAFQALRSTTGRANTIVIGSDVTHPGPGAYLGTPSIAAVVGSTDDHFMHFPGSMRLQRSRKEFIIELGDMVKERLIDWAEQHGGKLPDRMLFYRDGVSESQYEKIRTFEIPQLQKAYNWAREYIQFQGSKGSDDSDAKGKTEWPVPHEQDKDGNDVFRDETKSTANVPFQLTYVVVGKRHNTRFYPIDADNMISTGWDVNKKGWKVNGNIKPGFVIDRVITHPYSFDFYLQSHKPLAGTGKSAHYFVLQNNMGLNTNTLQNVTHAFCYAYSRSTTGVSYCAPAYYADRLCDRGRSYLRHWLTKICDDSSYKAEKVEDSEYMYKPHQPINKNAGDTFESYSDGIKNLMRDSAYWRPYRLEHPLKYGVKRRNPWHPNLDNIMFYL